MLPRLSFLPHTVCVLLMRSFNAVRHEVEVKVVVMSVAVLMIGPRVELTVTDSVMFSRTAVVHSVLETNTSGGDGADALASFYRFASYTTNVVCTHATRGYMSVASSIAVFHHVEVQIVPHSVTSFGVLPCVKLTVTWSVMFSCSAMVNSVFECHTTLGFGTQTFALFQG